MKKIIFVLKTMITYTTLFATKPPEVNQQVLKAFEETFKQPKDVVCHEYENFYEVDFKQGEIKTLVRYDSDGNITGTTRYYFESELPPVITSRLKKKYPERSVYGVTEIYTESDLAYYITMDNEKNWYTVKSNALGNLEQSEKFKKAPTK